MSKLRQMSLKQGRNKANKAPDRFCIGMEKEIKNKIKTTLEKVSICHFGLLVLVLNNNDCQIMEIKSVI